MYIWLRFLRLFAPWRKPEPLNPFTDTSILHYKAGLGDMDFNAHMNNGRYLTIMDMGRIDFGKRAGLADKMKHLPWTPLVAALTTSFRKEIRLGERFQLETRLLSWDEDWVYMEQKIRITSGKNAGALSCAAVIMACVFDVKAKKRVKVRDAFAAIGEGWREPDFKPEHISAMAGVSKAISVEDDAGV